MNAKPSPKLPRPILCALALAAMAAASVSICCAQTHPAETQGVGKYTGPGSCASTSCHGSISPRNDTDVLQNEYSTWIVKDKHSKSYQSLTGNVGERMAEILGLGKAENAPRCLACHALNVPDALRSRTFDLTEGVSCESCHGPAAGWLGPHTERDWPHQKSVALGMYDARDLVKRTEKCLSCHLGTQENYVNHEMIAAGHPALFFELDSFSAVMPRHWKETGEPGEAANNDPLYDLREMAIGQAVQLRDSLAQLERRTREKNWPEYAEIQCYACHHSLTPPEQSWRQATGYPGRQAGNPPWNESQYVVFRDVVHQFDPQDAEQLAASLTQVYKAMSQLSPDREAVASAAANSAHLADALVARITLISYEPESAMQLLQKILADADEISAQGEQSAAQAAMVIQSLFVALDRDRKLQNSADMRNAITALFQQLDNPSVYEPARFAHQMQQINAATR